MGGLLGGSGGTGGPFFPLFRTRTTAPDLPPGPPARDRRGDSYSLHHPPPLHTPSLSFLQMGARHEFSARPVPLECTCTCDPLFPVSVPHGAAGRSASIQSCPW